VAPDRIELIYRGVDERRFDPSLVSEARINHFRKLWEIENAPLPLITLPGRLSPWKGQDTFIQSLSRIKDHPWTALCIGDIKENASQYQHLRQMVSQFGLEKRIRFVGHCDDMPAAMVLSDVVVSASSTEPEAFGRIVVEAQAMGKPVIATAHGGSLETVVDGKTGWLVPPQDEDALSNALVRAIQNNHRCQEMGREGRKWVLNHFTVRRMCEKTLAVYEKLLNPAESGMNL
jgi:glycosyltransferase involved in cell wall biosynthesis